MQYTHLSLWYKNPEKIYVNPYVIVIYIAKSGIDVSIVGGMV